MTDPIPAATLVLFRSTGGRTEHLFLERAGTMAFAAGAIVFPGGRVEPGDRLLTGGMGALDPDDAAARVAAIRETLEESGVAVGITPMPDATTTASLREELIEGQVFADLLGAHGLMIDGALLTPFARWCPNFRETRTYDTRFYLAELPADAHAATVDATENVRLFWGTAAEVLADADAGRIQVIFPTRRNLERLAKLGDYASAREQAEAIAPELIVPWIEERGGIQHLCIPEDRGYPVTSVPLSEVKRG